ncbi:MAG: protein translocase subunit SecF [Streptosporangiaceae bacterium]|jgi:preprotein translocase subunit SecF
MSWIGNIAGRLYRGEVSFDFVGRRRLWYTISGLILVISLAALFGRGLNESVDFKGGSVFLFKAPAASQAQIRSTVAAAGGGPGAVVQTVGLGSHASWQVQTEKLSFPEQVKIQNAIAADLHPVGGAKAISSTFIGPTWGSQISQKALEALIAFLVVIVIYLSIAFEWKMATAALVALAHDIVITIGVYALAGFQVSPATVIGLLTILGYSLYDTVVVFDKVRENTAGLLGTSRSTYSQAANLALNQTLVRSINTSLIALLPVAAILVTGITLLGPGELEDLALVLFVGMLSGTYSSICIATPVLAALKEREPQYKALAKRVALRASGGRAAQRAKAKAAAGPDGRGASAVGTAEPAEPADPADDEAAADSGAFADQGPDERVPAARGAAAAPRAGSGARPGPRQQPRRTSAAKRRPAGKKKRR